MVVSPDDFFVFLFYVSGPEALSFPVVRPCACVPPACVEVFSDGLADDFSQERA